MKLPDLNVQERSREFRLYTCSQREAAVIRYVFDGFSCRRLDREVLGLDDGYSKGYQSMGILHHYGLDKSFKAIFKGMSPREVLDGFPEDRQYDSLYEIIERYLEYGFGTEYEESAIDAPASGNTGTGTFNMGALGFDRKAYTTIRVHQNDFRQKILDAYKGACCITGIHEPRMLIASHIKPWCVSSPTEKVDVRNGLCLNALHDSAFDSGLITVDSETLCVRLTDGIEKQMPQQTYEEYFSCYDGTEIAMPKQDCEPDREYLKFHNEQIFGKRFAKSRITYEVLIHE